MQKILFFIVVFITNAIQAITGFAGTLLAMPPSILLIGIDEAKIILEEVCANKRNHQQRTILVGKLVIEE